MKKEHLILRNESKRIFPKYGMNAAPVILEDFETIGDWSNLGGGTMSADAVNYKTGTKSVKMEATAGGNCLPQKTVNLDLSGASYFRLMFYLYDAVPSSTCGGFILYLATAANFSTYFYVLIDGFHTGWNAVNILKTDFVASGAAVWTDPIVRFRVRLTALAGQNSTASIDSFMSVSGNVPSVCLTFDDGIESVFTQAAPILRQYRGRATVYTITNLVNTAGYMKTSQLKELYQRGWTIGNHTASHPHLIALTQGEVETELDTARDFLVSIGCGPGTHVAYPYGERNATTDAAMAAQGMITGRTTEIQRRPLLPYGNPYSIEARYVENTTTLATAKGYVDQAITRGDIPFLFFHNLVTSPSVGTEWAILDFAALVAYIAAQGILMITVDNFYKANTDAITMIRSG